MRCGDPTCAIGGLIAFHSRRDDTQNVLGDIYVLDLEAPMGSEVQQMETSDAEEWPAFNLEGDTIAYTFRSFGPGNTSPHPSTIEYLYAPFSGVGLHSGVPRISTPLPRVDDPIADLHPDFSNDGTMLVYSSNRDHGPNDHNRDIYVDGARLTSDIAIDGWPSFSNDDKRVVFAGGSSSTRPDGGIFVTDVGAFPGSEVLIDQYPATTPDWSPVEDLIVYECGGRLCLIRSDGTGRVNVPRPSGFNLIYMRDPHWSPDGAFIVFQGSGSGLPRGWDLFIMRPDGSCARRITDTDLIDETQPTWGG